MIDEWGGHMLVIVHNFTARSRVARIAPGVAGSRTLVDLLWTNDSRADDNGRHDIQLEPYAYRWFRSRSVDRNVPRG